MSRLRSIPSKLILAAAALSGLALAANGCCHRPGHAYAHAGKACHKAHGPCCGGAFDHGKMGKGGKMAKGKSLGAPKLLCPKTLIVHAKMLGLSDDQVTKLKELKKESWAKKADFMLQMKRAKLALKAEWLKDQPDPGQIRALAKALWAVKQAKLDARTEALLKVKELLSAEQYKKILTKSAKGHAWGMGHHGKGHFGKGHFGRGGCAKGGCAKGCCAKGCCAKGGCGEGGCAKGCCAKGGCGEGGCAKGCCSAGGAGGAGCPCCAGRPGQGPRDGSGPGAGGPGAGGPGPAGRGPHAPCPTCVH